jgi:hypothetical protein
MNLKKVNKEAKDNFMLYIPQIKHTAWEERKGKVVLIFYHNKLAERLLRWLVKKPNVSDIELDELGSYVWKSIDGRKNIYEIGQEVLNVFGNSCEPVYDRLIMYMRYLARRGWINFINGNN